MKSLKPKKARINWGLSLYTGLVMAAILSTTVVAQTGVGTVSGTIRDAQHSVIAKADVTITNTETSVTRRGKSSEDGGFYFGGLAPGRYTLTVEISGFKKWSSSVLMEVGQAVAVEPLLEPIDIQTTVQMTGEAAPNSNQSKGGSAVTDIRRLT